MSPSNKKKRKHLPKENEEKKKEESDVLVSFQRIGLCSGIAGGHVSKQVSLDVHRGRWSSEVELNGIVRHCIGCICFSNRWLYGSLFVCYLHT